MLVPIFRTSRNVRTDRFQDGMVKNFALVITGWVVRSGPCFSDLHKSTKSLEQIRCEISKLVSMDLKRAPKSDNEMFKKFLGCQLSILCW